MAEQLFATPDPDMTVRLSFRLESHGYQSTRSGRSIVKERRWDIDVTVGGVRLRAANLTDSDQPRLIAAVLARRLGVELDDTTALDGAA